MRAFDRDQVRNLAQTQLNRITASNIAGQKQYTKSLVRSYFTRNCVKLDAAFRTLDRNANLSDVSSLADQINLFDACEAPVQFWQKQKKSGGYRTICDLPDKLFAAHLMIRDVLLAQFHPGDHLFAIKGRSRDDLAKSLKASLERGCNYAIQGDLRDAFSNVEVGALSSLPLPATVIRLMLDPNNLRFKHDPRRGAARGSRRSQGLSSKRGLHSSLWTRANEPRGLLQGSPASNALLAWLLNDLPSALPPGCVPHLYTDNVLVAVRTEEDCRRIEPALKSYFRQHSAGPFALEKIAVEAVEGPGCGILFLGYQFEREKGETNVIIVPGWSNLYKIIEDCCELAEQEAALRHASPDESLLWLRNRLSGFSSSTDLKFFSEWVGEMVTDAFNEVAWSR